jgi:hypothetical protein
MRRIIIPLLAFASVPAIAEDPKYPPDVQARIDEANAKKAEAEAREAQSKAEAEAAKAKEAAAEAQFGFLPKSPADGKVTLGSNAGAIETNMLVATALRAAAEEINKRAQSDKGTLLIAGDGSLSTDAYTSFELQAFGLEEAYRSAKVSGCAVEIAGAPAAGAFVGALANLLKNDTEIVGLDSALSNQQLARAVMEQAPDHYIAPDLRIGHVSKTNPVTLILTELRCRRDNAQQEIAAAGPKPKPARAKRSALLAGINTRYDEFIASLTKPGDGGKVPLGAVYQQSFLATNDKPILRVYVDKAAGSLLNRRNFWTMLGARAIGITGGVVASYTLSDPTTGAIKKAGLFRCYTEVAGLRKAQSGAISANCEDTTNPKAQ